MAWLKLVYERDPRFFSASELALILATITVYLWVIPFWYWGIYRPGVTVPEGLSDPLYWVWLHKGAFRVVLIVILVFVIFAGNYVRRDSYRELGIRADNIWASAKECLAVYLAALIGVAAILLAFPDMFDVREYLALGPRVIAGDFLEGFGLGLFQQFLLQSIFLVRALQIFARKSTAVLVSSVAFSVIHAPNILLMALTFVFGILCCLLFLRNRNVFVLGILHGLVVQAVRFLFISIVGYGADYYDFTLRVGPPSGREDYLAQLEYTGSPVALTLSSGISAPVSVTNKSTLTWNSKAESEPVFMSYHLYDEKGEMVDFENDVTPFASPVGPGQTAIVDLLLDAPPKPGNYFAEVDVVKLRSAGPDKEAERIFFRWRGSRTISIPISAR